MAPARAGRNFVPKNSAIAAAAGVFHKKDSNKMAVPQNWPLYDGLPSPSMPLRLATDLEVRRTEEVPELRR